jgi:hypothetical protein
MEGDDATRGWSRREWLATSAAAAGALWLGRATPAFAKSGEGDAVPDDLTPAQALQRLLDGNKRFAAGKANGPHRSLDRVHELAHHQQPFAAILSCADSRVPVELVFDQGFSDLRGATRERHRAAGVRDPVRRRGAAQGAARARPLELRRGEGAIRASRCPARSACSPAHPPAVDSAAATSRRSSRRRARAGRC